MPTTPYSAIPTPAATETYDLPTDLLDLATHIDSRVVVRVASLAARNALTSPPDGTLVVLTASPGAVWLRSGGAWVTVWDGAVASTLPFASVYRSTDQTFVIGGSKVTFDASTEVSSDITFASGRLTVSVAGVYTFTCAARVTTDFTGAAVLYGKKNSGGVETAGTTIMLTRWTHTSNFNSMGAVISKPLRLASGDHVEMFVRGSTASSVIAGADATYMTLVGHR